MPNDYSPNCASRKRAVTLNAVDANFLLSGLPVVYGSMTSKQIHNVQRVLDAAVVNPVVNREAEDLEKHSIRFNAAGDPVIFNQKLERQAEKARSGLIEVHESDYHIRMDYAKLLSTDALKPQTDNPDEAAYLKKIKKTLEKEGVWLRISRPFVRNAAEPSRVNTDPRVFEAWLSIGYDGEAIPAPWGAIDRSALLNTTLFGANYYKEVIEGTVQKTLESQIYRLDLDIQDGIAEHNRLIARYDNAFPGVAEISDALGGADLPSLSIWNAPKKALSYARDFQKKNIDGTQVFLLLASRGTRNAAQLLKTYAEKSTEGAALAANIAGVVAIASAVILASIDVTGIARGMAAEEAESLLAARFVAKNPEAQTALDALMKETEQISYVRMPKGSTAGGVKAGTSGGIGTGWIK